MITLIDTIAADPLLVIAAAFAWTGICIISCELVYRRQGSGKQ